MARANHSSALSTDDSLANAGQWQALRGELVALLDHVEGQYSRLAREPGYDALDARMRDLRQRVADPVIREPQARHREALRSVKRAVDRFNDQGELEQAPVNPQDVLQAAIYEIRAKQGQPLPPLTAANEPARVAVQQPQPSAQFNRQIDELAGAMSGLSGRLEHIEGELKSQRKANGSIKDVAEQVSQLTHVVELLAGAVGETGQVKRLEAQIANIASMVQEGNRPDIAAMTGRIDELSATLERLADIQIQHFGRDAKEGPERSAVFADGMRAIEQSVRNVYNRIDALERNTALAPADFERLTEEMAGFTAAMKRDDAQPSSLVTLVDALNSRIGEMEGRSADVEGLKDDIHALRATVVEAVEPRFVAIEKQLKIISGRIDDQTKMVEPTVTQIEAQVRRLAERMDETGAQITGLARLYEQQESRPAPVADTDGIERQLRELGARMDETGAQVSDLARLYQDSDQRQPAPDFDALAMLVATKTSEAFARKLPPPPVPGPLSLDEAGLSAIEARMTRLIEASAPDDQSGEFADMADGIKRVDARLDRLEATLSKFGQSEAAAPKAAAIPVASKAEAAPAPAPAPMVKAEAPAAPVAQAAPAPQPAVRIPGVPMARDAMPKNPSEDFALTDKPYAEVDPVRDALGMAPVTPPKRSAIAEALARELLPVDDEDDVVEIKPVLSSSAAPEAERSAVHVEPKAQVYDPTAAVRPPRPDSPFAAEKPETFAEPLIDTIARDVETDSKRVDTPAEPPVGAQSVNTFVQAHRRAAMRQPAPAAAPASNSLIGKALARFQNHEKPADAAAAPVAAPQPSAAPVTPAPAAKAAKPVKEKKVKPPKAEAKKRETAHQMLGMDGVQGEPAGEAKQPGFLTRYRRPLLLAALLLGCSVLAINLITQRLGNGSVATTEASAPAETAPAADVEGDVPVAEPTGDVSSLPETPGVDDTTVGSISATPVSAMMAPQSTLTMPTALQSALLTDAELDPMAIESPIKVDLPPDGLGPLEMREAAANGDARAQFEVAAIYMEGKAIPQDFAAAAVWYERSAAQGFAPAQYRLASLYESGKGLEKDLDQARLWYQRAADAGNRMSMHNLAALYAGGELGEQDFASAAEWFEQAASRGLEDSQFNLGMLYARGLGVQQSFAESYKWFSIAARIGDADAAKARDDVAKNLDAATMASVNDQLAGWTPVQIDLATNFAPIGTWSESFDPGATLNDKDLVLKVQSALARLGYDVGTPDGLAGPKTAVAIKAFEHGTGMSEIGQINPRLLAVLGSQPV